MAITEAEFDRAEERMEALREDGYVVSAQYDSTEDRIVLELSTGFLFALPRHKVQDLNGADIAKLAEIEISPSGLGLHWPQLDVDLYVPALLQGFFASKRWMASQLGAAGGKSRSDAKAAASRENGRKGGRPRKTASSG